jgi:aspartate/methionine/tyrosine aminotransferase
VRHDAHERLATLAAEDVLEQRRADGRPGLRLGGAASRPLPEHVRRAVAEAMDDFAARPPSRGLLDLRGAVAAWVGESGAVVDPDTDVLVTHGGMHALSIACRALLTRGDRVLIPAPAFYFGGPVELAGAEPVYVSSSPADGWRLDADALADAVDDRTRAIVVCNPVNPTGHLPDRTELEAVLAVAERADLLVVADESYERYVYDGAAITPILTLAGARSRTVLVRGVSKSFAMPGWRVGFLVGPAELLEPCVTLFEWECLRGNSVAQRAAAAAIGGPREWLADIVPAYERNRDLVYDALAASAHLTCVAPRACPFVFVASDEPGLDEHLAEAGVPFVAGRHFQASDYVRVPFGGERSAAVELADVFRSFGGRV